MLFQTICIALVFLASATSVAATSLKVMSYNILYGGDQGIPLANTIKVLQRADADLIGIQEADENGPKLAKALGYDWYEVADGVRRGGVLSRYPIRKVHGQGVTVTLPQGKEVSLFSVHLRSDPYEPYDLRDGKLANAAQAVASAHRGRGPELDIVLANMAPVLSKGHPVFLVGDFNEPSHLDWTERAHKAKLHLEVVPWPTSFRVLNAGFVDAFREARPDEVKSPGYTWTPLSTPGEIHDRIDYIYYQGNEVNLRKVDVVGEQGGPEVDLVGADPYPSDHRALLGHFLVR